MKERSAPVIGYTVKQWCEPGHGLPFSERYLREAIRTRRITVAKFGRKYVITVDAMQDFLNRHTLEALDAETEARRLVG